MKHITDDELRKIASQVEREYQVGGLTGGIYEDFALDVAKRAIAIERERCAQVAEAGIAESDPGAYNNACRNIAAAIRGGKSGA